MSPFRTLATVRLDLGHNLRRPLFWIWIIILGLMAWGFSDGTMRIQSGDSDVGGTKAFITSQFAVAQILTVLVLMVDAFFIAVAAGMTVLRDDELQVGAVIHATPLTPGEYVWGKFLAGLVSFLVILGLHLGLMAFFNHVTTGAEAAQYVGPFAVENYLVPALYLSVPTIVFLAGLSFWIGARFRRPILVFFVPVALLLLCVFLLWDWSPSWLPESVERVLRLVDPAGHRWLSETFLDVDRGVDFYNSAAIEFDTPFVISRVAMVVIGIGCAALAARHFARTLRGEAAPAGFEAALAATPPTAASGGPDGEPSGRRRRAAPQPLASLGMRSRAPGFIGGTLAVTAVEFRELRSSPGLYLFLPLIVMLAVMNAMVFDGPFETDVLLTSGQLAVHATGMLAGFVSALLMFYTVESLRREEGARLAAIHDATPVRTSSILFGKALANSLVAVVAIVLTFVTSVVILAVEGQAAIELWPFILVWGAVLLPTFIVWSTFVALVYALCRSRYTTYAVALAAFMATSYADETGGLDWTWNWPLWGALQWSDMGVFELVRDELLLNRLLALAAALAFAVLTVKLLPRRQADPTNLLLRMRPGPLLGSALRLSPILALPVALALVLDARIDAGFQGDRFETMRKDYWRKNVATWTEAPRADLAGVDVDLDLFPERRAFECRGTFRLANHTDAPLPVLALTRGLGWRRPDSLPADDAAADGPVWTLAGSAYEPEDSAGLMLFRPEPALAPGAEIEVGFHHSGEVPSGATENGGGASEFILPSGVVLTSTQPTFVPVVGYDPSIGIDDDNRFDQKRYPEDFYVGVTRSWQGSGDALFDVRVQVTAPAALTVNGIGVKRSDEVRDGRRVTVWETDHPVGFFNVVAGRWKEATDGHGTTVFHHPAHSYNVPVMLEALAGARRYYSEWFYPYPWQELKLSQFPGLATYAQGFATNITFSEAIGFLTKEDRDAAEAPFMVTAHEAAHQWWGNLLTPGEGPGANILSEGMAHFSTMLLLEQMRGEQARIDFCRRIEHQYGERRQADSERAMIWVDGSRPGDTTVTYDRGGLVFWMLLNQMGRARCLEGLQSFIAHYRTDPDHPVLQDLTAHLRPFAPDPVAYDAFVAQWIDGTALPRYQIRAPQRSGDAANGWTVTCTIENTGTGSATIEVAAATGERFANEPDAGAEAGPAYRDARTAVTLGAGESVEAVVRCDFEPDRIVLDPDVRVLMLQRKLAIHEF